MKSRLLLTLGVLACALFTLPLPLAGPASTTGPALLPPPSFEWHASPWARDIEISRTLHEGSGIEYAVGSFRARKLCNGGGNDNGEMYQSCHYAMDRTSDTEYSYVIREFASDAKFVLRTDCEPMDGAWLCTRKAAP